MASGSPPVEENVQTDDSAPEEGFHEFASAWLESRKPDLTAASYEDYRWALTHHLLPYFKDHKLSEITVREVDAFKAYKLTEAVLSPNVINKVLTRLSQVLSVAVDYELIVSNPAGGKRRRVKGTRPRRLHAEPEQLMCLLKAAEAVPSDDPKERKAALLGGRGRVLLATLAGAGLRIDEALSLQRRHVNTARGTITVERSKTDAGIRVVELPPALCEELALYLDSSKFKRPTDYVFPTSTGKKDNRNNVRRGLFVKAIERANPVLIEKGIEPLGDVRPHGLRRSYASLRLWRRPGIRVEADRPHRCEVHPQRLRAVGEAAGEDDRGREEGVRPGRRVGLLEHSGTRTVRHARPRHGCRAKRD